MIEYFNYGENTIFILCLITMEEKITREFSHITLQLHTWLFLELEPTDAALLGRLFFLGGGIGADNASPLGGKGGRNLGHSSAFKERTKNLIR